MSVDLLDGVTLTVEAALSASTGTYGAWDSGVWDTSTWGPDEAYVDISDYLRSLSTNRQFSREVQAWQAGSATVVLDNQDGRFSADNLAGSPYVTSGISEIRPWRPVRVRASYAGTTYGIFKGYAKDWLESWPSLAAANAGDAIVTVPLADEWAVLSGFKGLAVDPAVGAGDSFGRRVHRILDNAGHAGPRIVDTGSNTMQETDLSEDTTSALTLVADSEGGAVWVDHDGAVVGARQYSLVEESRSITSQATFGDGGGSELPYSDIQLGNAGDLIVNIAAYKREGGTTQTFTDATSRALYRDKRDARTDLICETDAQAMQLAAWKVARYKAPERRVTAITVQPRRNPATLFPIVLGLRVRDLITVKRRPPGGFTVTQRCHIAGISHAITPANWETTFYLWSATPYVAFASSLWDTGLWGASDTDTAGALWFY